MNLMQDVKPQPGDKFVAFFNDGSGARLFLFDDNGDMWDTDFNSRDVGVLYDIYSHWIKLPDDFKFWGERRPEPEPNRVRVLK